MDHVARHMIDHLETSFAATHLTAWCKNPVNPISRLQNKFKITRKRAIAKALHLEGHSDFAPDVVDFSGLFGLKILFSDVFRSAPGDRRVDSA